ncbi:L,D-transpeptidase family protein [Arabiibacter massiliensis]|uniref:L,D-transpeptidase family protein n=1 Tax=Arabiibacter massiliensis TaxID=1870985 RepID=UPI001E440DA3|nr:L,D-transpeptidase family protein [Arabiibacter massiliensis]
MTENTPDNKHARPEGGEPEAPRISVPPVIPPDATRPMPQPVRPADPKAAGRRAAHRAGEPAYAPGAPMRPVAAGHQMAMPDKRRSPLKIVGIVIGVLIALLLVAYVGIALYFTGRFMPNTAVGERDVSLMSSSEVEGLLADAMDDYALSIDGQGFSLSLTAAEADMFFDGAAVVRDMLADVNPWSWPLELAKQHDETDKLVARYSESGLDQAVRTAVGEFNASAVQPVDASITYDAAQASFVVVPETEGTALDADKVVKAADEAIANLEQSVTLDEGFLLRPKAFSTDKKLVGAAEKANTMIQADLVLQMSGTTAGEVNADLVSQWVKLDENLDVTLDEGALAAWVDELAAKCDTVGTTRAYTRADGKALTVSGGVYGWSVDHDALLSLVKEGVASGRVDTVDVPCTTTGTAYNGAGARDWGSRYVDIDLSEQYVRFYDDSGALAWESACITGIPDGEHDTPSGVYWLNQKQSPSKLIGYNGDTKIYETEVQYWMPFVGNAIGLHDAEWQTDFGGTLYADGAGSHGCVNLPPSKAAELYALLQGGDVVVCHW